MLDSLRWYLAPCSNSGSYLQCKVPLRFHEGVLQEAHLCEGNYALPPSSPLREVLLGSCPIPVNTAHCHQLPVTMVELEPGKVLHWKSTHSIESPSMCMDQDWRFVLYVTLGLEPALDHGELGE